MKSAYHNMRVAVFNNPIALDFVDTKLKNIANNYLPVHTGFEIECANDYEAIDNRLDKLEGIIECGSSYDEIRFRITSGIKGMIALSKALEIIKEYAHPNPINGIHYHISADKFHEYYRRIDGKTFSTIIHTEWFKEAVSNPILKSLLSWNYSGSYNSWEVSTEKRAVRIHDCYHTLEYRIGEHTFDYNLIMKRITHCHSLTIKATSNIIKLYNYRFL